MGRRRKREQDLGFKFHGFTFKVEDTTYQVTHQNSEYTYGVPVNAKGIVGGGIVRFPRNK